MNKSVRRRGPLPLWLMCGALAGLAFTIPLHLVLLWSLWP